MNIKIYNKKQKLWRINKNVGKVMLLKELKNLPVVK